MNACPVCGSAVREGSPSCAACGEKFDDRTRLAPYRPVTIDVWLAILIALAALFLALPTARLVRPLLRLDPVALLFVAGFSALLKLRYGKWSYGIGGLCVVAVLSVLSPILHRVHGFWWALPIGAVTVFCGIGGGRRWILPGLLAGAAASFLIAAGDYLHVPLTPVPRLVRASHVGIPTCLLLAGVAVAGLIVRLRGRPRILPMAAAWAITSAALWGARWLPDLEGWEFVVPVSLLLAYPGYLAAALWSKSNRLPWPVLLGIAPMATVAWWFYSGDAAAGIGPWIVFAAVLAAAHHRSAV